MEAKMLNIVLSLVVLSVCHRVVDGKIDVGSKSLHDIYVKDKNDAFRLTCSFTFTNDEHISMLETVFGIRKDKDSQILVEKRVTDLINYCYTRTDQPYCNVTLEGMTFDKIWKESGKEGRNEFVYSCTVTDRYSQPKDSECCGYLHKSFAIANCSSFLLVLLFLAAAFFNKNYLL